MNPRPRWSSDELEQERGLAASYFTKEVLPNVPKGRLDVTTAAMAKYWITDQACIVADRARSL